MKLFETYANVFRVAMFQAELRLDQLLPQQDNKRLSRKKL